MMQNTTFTYPDMQILRPTGCTLHRHVFIYASGGSNDETPVGLPCLCGLTTYQKEPSNEQTKNQ